MSKINIAEIAGKLFSLLQPLKSPDRQRVIQAALVLLGESALPPAPPATGGGSAQAQGAHGVVIPPVRPANTANAQQYFAQKNPQNKGEMLAVAAKFREEREAATSHTKEDFAKFFSDARQNFDSHNFQRDMKNVRNQAHLFNKGTPQGQYQLSYYGQQYVDALPDRDAIKKLKRPGRKGAKGKKAGSKN